MSRITWDEIGSRLYETGVKKTVLYPMVNGAYTKGVAWNGITNITENPSGAEMTPLYADDIKYLNLQSSEDYKSTIEAYTYPDEFAECDGSAEIATGVSIGQQTRKPFGLSYVTAIGNDTDGTDYGYKIHFVYGGTAAPSDKQHGTVNESPEAVTFSWEVSTTPVEVPGFKPTASVTIDSTKVAAAKLAEIENIIYGTAQNEPRLPLPAELITLLGA